MNPSTAIAQVLVDELIAGGMTDAVLAPGSRNAPLSMALFEADRDGRLRLHVRIDERTAGFLALGLARTSGRTVAVVTTSGTAVANLHPAVVEADMSGVPLLLLTADRPPMLRDVGANQVIDQVGIFGKSLRFFHEFQTPSAVAGQNARWRSMVCRALAHAVGASGNPGPVQLNVPLADPLMPGAGDWIESLEGHGGPWTQIDIAPASGAASILLPAPDEKCLFLADFTHPLAGSLAAAGYLVISEAAGAAGAAVLDAGLHLLADESFMSTYRPDRVIVLGRPTLYRQVTALLTDSRVWVDLVAPPAGWRGIAGNARRVSATLDVAAQPAASNPIAENVTGSGGSTSDWALAWTRANAAAADAVAKVLDEQPFSASLRLAREFISMVSDGSQVVVGSSQPGRDVGLAAAPRDGLQLRANRGAAGIDGTISTAVGAALAFSGSTFAYLGDVTFLHDLTGLIIGPDEPRPDLTILVSNNDGGGIFSTLESGDPLHNNAFERVFGTPHHADLEAVVRGLGAEYLAVSSTTELMTALAREHAVTSASNADPQVADRSRGVRVIEVKTTRADLRELGAELKRAVAAVL